MPTNGFTFGQSQSFPGASQQHGANGTASPFSFGGGGGVSSFNFSAGPSTTAPNPFASMSTAGPSQQPDGSGFSGFKGSIFNLPPASSTGPAQQPLPSGSLFGNTNTSAPSTGVTNATAGASLFGQPTVSSPGPSTPVASTGIFGSPSPEKTSPLGQSTAGDGGDSMQTSPDAKSSITSKPSIFGNGNTAPPKFGAIGGGGLFSSTTAPASGQSPTKPPLFGAKPAEQSIPPSPSIFGATTHTTSTATISTAAPSNPLAAASPAKPPTQNLFQTPNLFSGASSNPFQPTGEKQEEKKPSDSSAPKSPFQFTASTTSGPSFFKSENTAPPATSGGLFGPKPSLGASQSPSTGNMFAPEPPATTEQSPPKTPDGNPFGGLFAPKPSPSQQAPASKPEEPKQQPPASTFGSLFAPKPSAPAQEKPAESAKPATFAPMFSASTPAAGTAKPPSLFQPSNSVFQPPSSTPAAPPQTAPKEPAPQRLETMEPKGLSVDLNKHLKGNVELLNRVRILNESFKREITNLDPAKDDFDLLILYYMRVRETIGAPTGGEHQPKRKSRDEESTDAKDAPVQKKVKPFGESIGPSSPAPQMDLGPSSITSTPSKLFGATETPKSSKRKADEEGEASFSESSAAKRSHGDSATASIFAQTFSNSKSAESEKEADKAEPPKSPVSSPFKPATPESKKVAPESTTPTTSPAKSLFPPPAASTSTPLFGQPASASKPASTPSSNAPANPFTLKPTENKDAAPSTASSFQIPKFGSGSGTNFFAQFKSQAAQDAEKEKAKRKEEDFDSEDDDEAEWERKDAEEQRKKREQFASQTQKRAKFVPGKGFVFEDDSSAEAPESQKTEETAFSNGPSISNSGTSVFDAKKSPMKSSNIFGHLSATPTEVEENDGDDTEEDEATRVEREPKAATASADTIADDSEDGDFGKALKKSKAAAMPEKAATSAGSFGQSTTSTTPALSSGSLFDHVQSKEDENKGDSTSQKNPFASLFSTPRPASSSGSTPSIFAPAASSSSSTSIFGSGSSLFGSGPATSGTSTGSIFGASPSATKPSNDHTWKMDSPIKFATDSTSKPESGGGTPATEAPKPFSTLFGATPAEPKPSTAGSQPSLGFTFGAPSFGAPSQQTSVFSSAADSATTSNASTPGVTPDAGGNDSKDGEAAEALPQADLSRGGAGEEDEDVLMEIRGRGLKLKPHQGWDSQGVGFVRVLKNRTTSRSRILLRADPSGNVVLNASLMKAIKYTVSGTSVQFTVPKPDGSMEQWAIRVKKEDAERLGSTMEDAKA